jgi:DNA-binding transcriptional MerR regulator
MSKDGVTINELSKMANVTVRTIRFYTDEGVLDEPAGRDRYARYTRRHYLQLCAAKNLKERFLPLRVIRDQMASMDADDLERLAGPVPAAIEQRFADMSVEQEVSGHMYAVNELRAVTYSGVMSKKMPEMRRMLPQLASESANLLDPSFASAPGAYDNDQSDVVLRKPIPTNLGETWNRISISPSLELHVRDDGMTELGEIRRILAALRRSKS